MIPLTPERRAFLIQQRNSLTERALLAAHEAAYALGGKHAAELLSWPEIVRLKALSDREKLEAVGKPLVPGVVFQTHDEVRAYVEGMTYVMHTIWNAP